jgi:hypothetical protein
MSTTSLQGSLQSDDLLYPYEGGFFEPQQEKYYDDVLLSNLTAGQPVIVRLESEQVTPRLELFQADDLSQALQQISAPQTAQLSFTAQPGTSYILRITSQTPTQVGSYRLTSNLGLLNPVPPYQAEALTQQGQYRWPGRLGQPIRLTYSFMEELPAYYKPNRQGRWDQGTRDFKPMTQAQRSAVKLALQKWADVAGITFREAANPNAAQLRFGTAIDRDNDSLGWAYLPNTGVGIWSGDMWLNHREPSNRNPTPGSYGFATILHEIGHALGLSHPFDEGATLPKVGQTAQYTVMAYEKHPDLPQKYQPQAPMLYDIEAIQQLYGKNFKTNRNDTVYRWQPAKTFIETIYDVGGTDTIDAQNQRQNVVIKLEPGQFSSIGGFRGRPIKDNLTIAFGVSIENASGGTGNDTLSGNAGANTLSGNTGDDLLIGLGGNDRLIGGAGNDTFVWQAENDGIDAIVDFGQGNDVIDVSRLVNQIGYTGNNPFRDGILIAAEQQGSTLVSFDRDGAGSGAALPLVILDNFTDLPTLQNAVKFTL